MESTCLFRERSISAARQFKLLCFALLVIVFSFSSSGQEGVKTPQERFSFVNLQNASKELFFRSSIDAANMEAYRLKSKRVTLHFENGFDIEMLSAQELYMKDHSILVGSYPDEFPKNYLLPYFNILADGHLVAFYTNPGKPSFK